MHTPLDILIIKATQDLLRTRGVGHAEPFASDLRDCYEKMVPAELRTVTWSASQMPSTRLNSDWKHVRRYMERNPKLPAELVAPWLHCLPEDMRREVLAEWLEQFGCMPARLASVVSTTKSDTSALAALMREVAEAVEAIAPMLDNGVFDQTDIPFARQALLQLSDVISEATNLQRRIASILPQGGA